MPAAANDNIEIGISAASHTDYIPKSGTVAIDINHNTDTHKNPMEYTKRSEDVEIDEAIAHAAMNPTMIECFKHCQWMMYSTMVASFGGILFGYDTAALNGILIMPSFLQVMGEPALSIVQWANLESWITSSLLLGAFFAAPFAAPLADTFGRKVCINLSCLIIAVGAVIQAASQNPGTMIAGRVIVGAAIGLLSACVPMYLAEVSPKSVRGSISSVFEVTVAFGILLAFLITLGFNQHSVNSDGSYYANNWRYILTIQAGLAIVLSVFMIPIPESPRWLVSVDRNEEARQALISTRWVKVVGRVKKENGEYEEITNIDLELDEMADEVNHCRANKSAWWDFSGLFAPSVFLRTSIGIIIKFLQQLTGINSIFYYSSIIFQGLGIQPDTTTAVTGAVNVAATFIAVFFIDKVGRRPLLVWGSIGMMICLFIVGSLVYATDPTQVMPANGIAVFIMLFIVNFAYSYGPIAWLYPAEIFPVHVRAQGVSISTSADWLANFAVSKSVPGMVLPGSSVGGLGGTFMFFGAWSFVMTLWALANIHETANLTLEHMDDIFGVDTWNEYMVYQWKNIKYTFYFGPKTMYEYTHEDEVAILGENDTSHHLENGEKRFRSPTIN